MMQERLSSIGKEVGIDFLFGGRTGSTRESHRLIQFAKTKGPESENKVVNALFEGYFEKEQVPLSSPIPKHVSLRCVIRTSLATTS